MTPSEARKLIKDTFTHAFDKGRFRAFAINLLNHHAGMHLAWSDQNGRRIWDATAADDAPLDMYREYRYNIHCHE